MIRLPNAAAAALPSKLRLAPALAAAALPSNLRLAPVLAAAALLSNLWPAPALAAVPDVTAGPELAEDARLIEAPITDVTVFSDRARVRRTARLSLPAGATILRLPDLPGAVMMDSVRVEATGAKVLRIETTPIERERLDIEQVEKLITRLEDVHRRISEIDGRTEVLAGELELMDALLPAAPVPEPEREGRLAPAPQLATWRTALDFVRARRAGVQAALRRLESARRDLDEELEKVRREVARHDLGAFTDRKVQVVAILSASKPVKARAVLEYFVPGASWHPSYELHFEPSAGTVALNTGGLVRQASGEDWSGVRLALSTAIPGQGIALPELLTWTLGERRDFVPRPRPDRPQPHAARHAPPRPQPIASEAERAARREAVQGRVARLNQLVSMQPGQLLDAGVGSLGSAGVGLMSTGGGGYGSARGSLGGSGRAMAKKDTAPPRPQARPSRSRAAPPPGAPPMPMAAPEPSDDLADEMGTRTLAVESTSSRSSQRSRSSRKAEQVAHTSLALLEPGAWRSPTFSDPTLPAVLAGGLDYVYESKTPATIPSTGQALLVPLTVDTWPAKTHYEATPALSTTAYLSAEVQNRGRRPILQGPLTIFAGGDFVGEGRLETTGPGGTIRLPLGADEDIRIVHTVVPETKTEGLIKKTEETLYTTTIEIGNYEKRDVELVIFDVLPKTNNQDLEVLLVQAAPEPVGPPDGNGRLQWRVTVPAGKSTTLRFQYAIRRPVNWQLFQR